MFSQELSTGNWDVPLCFDVTECFPDLSNSEYHARSEYSSSFIKNVSSHSVGRALYELENSDQEKEAYINGDAFHEFMETGILPSRFAIKPTRMSFSTKEGRLFQAENDGKHFIKEEYFNGMVCMRDSIFRLEWLKDLLKNPNYIFRYEWSFAADGDDEITRGMKFRVRPDLHIVDKHTESLEWIIDWKSVEDIKKLSKWKFDDFGYPIQGVMYSDILGIHPSKFVFICVEKKPPYSARVFMMSEEKIRYGREKLIEAIGDIKNYLETGEQDLGLPEIIWV